MDPLENLINDIIASADVYSWGVCLAHPRGETACLACAINHVSVWDAPLALLIAVAHRDAHNDDFAILHDYLTDKGLEHHEEQIMRDIGRWIQWECQPWRCYR